MSNDKLSKQELIDVLKYGHNWHAERIKGELEKLVVMSSRAFNHQVQYDTDDKFHYVYDNECYLFVFDGRIEVRCDRDNVFSANQTIEFPIRGEKDILAAYEKFKSTILEGEEDEDE